MSYRYIISVLFILLGLSSLKAQMIVSGQIVSLNTENGIANHAVIIESDTNYSHNFTYHHTIYTDNNGNFKDTIAIAEDANVKIYIQTYDCQQQLHRDSVYSFLPMPIKLALCPLAKNFCFADFIAYPDTANVQLVHFFDLSSSNASSYLWDFGDGQFSNLKYPNHVYSTSGGSYEVCLLITDTNSNCSSTFCDSVILANGINCQSSITYHQLTPNKFTFTGDVNVSFPSIYNWEFGDGSIGNGKSVQHLYNATGNYLVKLSTISLHPQTLDTCISHSQMMISVNNMPNGGIWGQVFADNHSLDLGQAQLYEVTNSTNQLTLKASAPIILIDSLDISYYLFPNQAYGKYVVGIKPLAASNFHQTHGPSYTGNTFYWNQASIINLNQSSVNTPINLTHLYKLNGTNTLSGNVYYGNPGHNTNPAAAIGLFILDQNGVPVDYQLTDINGYYLSKNLILQKYSVYTDLINHQIIPSTGHINENHPNLNGIDIYISNGLVSPYELTSIAEQIRIYPNPTNDLLSIELKDLPLKNASIQVYNLLGQIMLYFPNLSPEKASDHLIQINTNTLETGIYLIEIQLEDGRKHFQKIIKTT